MANTHKRPNSHQEFHKYSLRIYYEDTDAIGLIYHSNYLKYAERARTEFLRDLGQSHTQIQQAYGQAFVLRKCTLDYLSPGHLDDWLTIETQVTELKRMSVTMEQQIRRDNNLLVQLMVRLACIDNRGKPVPIPEEFAKALNANGFLKVD